MSDNQIIFQEIEVRLIISDVESLQNKIDQLNVQCLGEFHFIDHFYKPNNTLDIEWDPRFKTMRIREFNNYSRLLFDKVQYLPSVTNKYSIKKSDYFGKIILYEGESSFIKKILDDLGFIFWFTIEHTNVKSYRSVNPFTFNFTVEMIKPIGWMIEIEVLDSSITNAHNKINEVVKILDIQQQEIIAESLPSLFLSINNIINNL